MNKTFYETPITEPKCNIHTFSGTQVPVNAVKCRAPQYDELTLVNPALPASQVTQVCPKPSTAEKCIDTDISKT